jgi:type I restriction enzyme S subunit
MSPLGEVFDSIRNGMNVKQDKSSGGLPITRIETISKGIVDPERVGYAGLRREDCEEWLLREGDILFSHINSVEHIAKCAIYRGRPDELVHGMNLLRLRADRAVLDPHYAVYAMRAPGFRARIMPFVNRAVNQASISIGNLKSAHIPLPPLDEQARIVGTLDEVETLRAKRRQAITLLDDLIRSVFLDMFGDPVNNPRAWDRLPMKDFLKAIDSGSSPKCLDRPAREGEWGVLKLGAVTQCVYLQGENKALPEGEDPQARHEVKAGDLLLSRKNTPDLVGAAAYVRRTRERLLMPDLIFRLALKQDAPVDGVYLHALLTHPGKRKVLQSLASGSAASMVNISKQKLLGLLCEVPPLDLQSEFSRRVAAAEQQKEVHKTHLAALDELFASLQQRAFSGSLWDREVAV